MIATPKKCSPLVSAAMEVQRKALPRLQWSGPVAAMIAAPMQAQH
jgi:hypothetical protein